MEAILAAEASPQLRGCLHLGRLHPLGNAFQGQVGRGHVLEGVLRQNQGVAAHLLPPVLHLPPAQQQDGTHRGHHHQYDEKSPQTEGQLAGAEPGQRLGRAWGLGHGVGNLGQFTLFVSVNPHLP